MRKALAWLSLLILWSALATIGWQLDEIRILRVQVSDSSRVAAFYREIALQYMEAWWAKGEPPQDGIVYRVFYQQTLVSPRKPIVTEISDGQWRITFEEKKP